MSDQQFQCQDYTQILNIHRKVEEQLKNQIQQYKICCDSLYFQKEQALKEIQKLKNKIQFLNEKLERQRQQQIQQNNQNKKVKFCMKSNVSWKINSSKTFQFPFQKENKPLNIQKNNKNKEFINENKHKQLQNFNKAYHTKSKQNFLMESQTKSEASIFDKYGQFLIQDFVVVSPDLTSLNIQRQLKLDQNDFQTFQFNYININNLYGDKKKQYLQDISHRAFPFGYRPFKLIVNSFNQLKCQFQTLKQSYMNQCFVFNLTGDIVQNNQFLQQCNSTKALYVICIKIIEGQFIQNKQLKNQQMEILVVEKVYAILTYYPYFYIHKKILNKIRSILSPSLYTVSKQLFLQQNNYKNMHQIHKNQQFNKFIHYLMNLKPSYEYLCTFQNQYFGIIPSQGFLSQYSICRYACGIFFSIFAYDQMLLLLASVFMQKNIIFISKNQSAATFCALFLVNILSPFVYKRHLILNCNKQILDMVFSFPMPMIATVKRQKNYSQILTLFIQNTMNHFEGFQKQKQGAPHVLVDIDSNCIFYDPKLNKILQKIIISPSDQLHRAYLQVNPSISRSFTLPKKMPVQLSTKVKTQFQKNAIQKKKKMKQYNQKIQFNYSKWPTFNVTQSHLKILNLLIGYIRSFSIDDQTAQQIIQKSTQNHELIKSLSQKYLLQRHPDKSQLFADYMDDINRKQNSQK